MSYYQIEHGDGTNFQKEITNMLHGFGDNPNPNAATVVLVESIVLQQLRGMLQEGLISSNMRGAKGITNYDIIFLMRKNPVKLRRLHDYQLKLDNIDKCRSMGSAPATDVSGFLLDDEKDPTIKKKRTHLDVIEELDETDEVEEITFDTIDYLRKIRASKLTESMSFDKYEAYHKARCVSFRTGPGFGAQNKAYMKLERWLNPVKELKISWSALEVLCFLAYETVAELVDGVYLIRQDSKRRSGDQFSKLEGGYFCNPLSLNNAVYIKSGYEGVPPITVAEIREVLRRHFAPSKGLNGMFYRNMSMDLPGRFIAI